VENDGLLRYESEITAILRKPSLVYQSLADASRNGLLVKTPPPPMSGVFPPTHTHGPRL
jgi:hypothetical protein